jgi:hypothetical protein
MKNVLCYKNLIIARDDSKSDERTVIIIEIIIKSDEYDSY